MKRSVISLLVAGLFGGMATLSLAADNANTNVQTAPKQVESSQSRAADPNTRDTMNDTSKDIKQDKTTASDKNWDEKTAADFKRADKDNDGTLDRKEARKMHHGVAKNFDAIDADKDGTISMDELNTYMAANPHHKKGNM